MKRKRRRKRPRHEVRTLKEGSSKNKLKFTSSPSANKCRQLSSMLFAATNCKLSRWCWRESGSWASISESTSESARVMNGRPPPRANLAPQDSQSLDSSLSLSSKGTGLKWLWSNATLLVLLFCLANVNSCQPSAPTRPLNSSLSRPWPASVYLLDWLPSEQLFSSVQDLDSKLSFQLRPSSMTGRDRSRRPQAIKAAGTNSNAQAWPMETPQWRPIATVKRSKRQKPIEGNEQRQQQQQHQKRARRQHDQDRDETDGEYGLSMLGIIN